MKTRYKVAAYALMAVATYGYAFRVSFYQNANRYPHTSPGAIYGYAQVEALPASVLWPVFWAIQASKAAWHVDAEVGLIKREESP